MKNIAETDAYIVSDYRNEEPHGSDEAYQTRDPSKLKVECICPKCQQKHSVVIHWIGRGTPRKYCNRCRDQVESAFT